jgi:putative phosphoesterase
VKVLLLADIHANLPALVAVLEASSKLNYDEIWCLGDIVGYGPFPNECALLIRQKAARVIVGNHDAKVVSARKISAMADAGKEFYKVFVFAWTHRQLSAEVTDYLKALPETDSVVVEGQKIFLAHGSPDGMNDGISPYTPAARLEALAQKAGAGIILVGHTHEAFSRQAPGAVFINPGAVGRPFDGDPHASFAILDFSAKGVTVDMHRVAYDMGSAVAEMKKHEFPPLLVKAFVQARSPADILPDDNRGDLLDEAARLGVRCNYEKPHALQVAMLSLQIFDALSACHGLGPRARALLQAGALLHDAGIARGADGHHKASRDIILEDKTMPLSERERVVVALIARYHRRSLPRPEHKHFAFLPDYHKRLVEQLGGIVRMADGLDRSHKGLVKGLEIEVSADAVKIKLDAQGDVRGEIEFGTEKADLFERAFGKKVIIAGK